MTGTERTWLPYVSDTDAAGRVWYSQNCLEEFCVQHQRWSSLVSSVDAGKPASASLQVITTSGSWQFSIRLPTEIPEVATDRRRDWEGDRQAIATDASRQRPGRM